MMCKSYIHLLAFLCSIAAILASQKSALLYHIEEESDHLVEDDSHTGVWPYAQQDNRMMYYSNCDPPMRSWREATDNIQENYYLPAECVIPPLPSGHVEFGGKIPLLDRTDSWEKVEPIQDRSCLAFDERVKDTDSPVGDDEYVVVDPAEASNGDSSVFSSISNRPSDVRQQDVADLLFAYWDQCNINPRMRAEALADGVDKMQTLELSPDVITRCMVRYLRRRQADPSYVAAFEHGREEIDSHRTLIEDQKRRARQRAIRVTRSKQN